jgi:hypothetical protein
VSGVLLVIPDDSHVWKKAGFMAQSDRRYATADRRIQEAQTDDEPAGRQRRLDGII